ncbi:PREDICTED: vanin-like protein 2 [Dufourea novaeangliae]|uniref:vanin-like protein 2 n=1 Tax=Dufourea novaeangliae TaxID=178035 RepID=UPI0007679ADF|nr:PREDICTED: vanin-like protein 2 [Dufourea novaeangliae]XP_015435414.1 PREDICTED: vanin-like protein 2 [Dufourea novaeangliae]
MGRRIFRLFGFFLTLVHLSQQATATEHEPRNYYIAAVVEFSPKVEQCGPLTLQKNREMYIEYIEKAKKQDSDIIVFPEDGLTSVRMPEKSEMMSWATVVPSADEKYVPCEYHRPGVSETLKQLSCAARNNSIYLVVNIAEMESCDLGQTNRDQQCFSVNGTRYHNTNVVFDRTGRIIARYRKVNLYMEKQFDTVEPPEVVTFNTDFNVTFGTFTCFDILFYVPALNLTRTNGITNIVYTTAWFSEAPFLTAVQTQFGWSYAEDVNLLAAGYHNAMQGNTGSGIYLGRDGIAEATFSNQTGHRLLVSRVPKTRTSRENKTENAKQYASTDIFYATKHRADTIDGIRILRDNLEPFESVPLNGTSMNETICIGTFCCDFDVRTTHLESSSNYRAVVYNGIRLYGTEVKAAIRVCALTQCSNHSTISCGVVQPSNVTFLRLTITAKLADSPVILAMPTVLNSSLLPFEQWTYNEHIAENLMHLTLALNQSTNDLATFGIYVREFARDHNGNVKTVPSFVIVLSCLSILMFSLCLFNNLDS